MKNKTVIIFLLLTCFYSFVFPVFSPEKGHAPGESNTFTYDEVLFHSDTVYRKLILDTLFQVHYWDTIPQPVFWQKVMKLSADSATMSVHSTRVIVDVIETKKYNRMSKKEAEGYRDSLKKVNNLPDSARLLFTPGKNFFYTFENAIPNIDTGISVFIENGVDPWFAQAILLIESPNKLQKSNVGAYGSFQLMKGVAKKYGLKVSKKIDERKDLKRSAFAASQLMKRICIPSVREMLDYYCIPYNESDLWFRLLVMHVYHAGAFNVRKVIDKISPVEGGMALIYRIWVTEAGAFRNASQNYSQVLIAALIELNVTVNNKSKIINKGCVSELK